MDIVWTGDDARRALALFFMANQFHVAQYQWQAALPVLADPAAWRGVRDSSALVMALHCLDDFAGT